MMRKRFLEMKLRTSSKTLKDDSDDEEKGLGDDEEKVQGGDEVKHDSDDDPEVSKSIGTSLMH